MRAHINAAILAGLCMLSPAQAQEVEKPGVKISLDWAFQGPQSVFLYGAERGEFKKRGVDVTIDRGSGSGDTITRVASGAYDFGWADIATMVKFNAQNPGKGLMAVYVTGGNSPLAVITVKGRGIESPKDLAGKALTATAGSAALALFNIFAKDAGFDPKSVTWKQVSGALREPMMVRGDADAAAGFTTSSVMSVVELGVKRDDVVTFKYNDYGLKQYGTALLVRPEFAKENPKTVAAVVAAVNASFMDAIRDPKASVKTIKARDALVNLDIECVRLLEGLRDLTLTDEFKTKGISSVDNARIAASVAEIKDAYELKTDVPADTVFTAAFLPAQAERMPPALGSCQ